MLRILRNTLRFRTGSRCSPAFQKVAALSMTMLAPMGCAPSEESGSNADLPAEMLFVGDPFAYTIERNLEWIEEQLDSPIVLTIERYSNTRESILRNARDSQSFYNLVSFDTLWLQRFVDEGVLDPITAEDLESIGITKDHFYPQTLAGNLDDGKLYGLPFQPHFELLFYRKDWLAAENLEPPKTFQDLLTLARRFHSPEQNRYGVCWNGLRGQAFGQTIAHLYASFGHPVLDSEGRPQIDTETGREVLRFLQELLTVSPPDVLTMAWDQRIERFQNGQAAFTYGWGARSMSLEHDPVSQVAGKVGYASPPSKPGVVQSVPFGQWNLGLPSNLTPKERERSLLLLRILLSDSMYEGFRESGLETLHRMPPSGKTEETEYSSTCRAIFEEDRIAVAARPNSEHWTRLAEILGTTFHDALLGRLSDDEALEMAQSSAEAVMGPKSLTSP